MLGVNVDIIACHRLDVKPDVRSVQQKKEVIDDIEGANQSRSPEATQDRFYPINQVLGVGIECGHGEEVGWKMENVRRLHKSQSGVFKRLLATAEY